MKPSLNRSETEIAVHLAHVDKSFRNGDQVTPVLRQVEFELRTRGHPCVASHL